MFAKVIKIKVAYFLWDAVYLAYFLLYTSLRFACCANSLKQLDVYTCLEELISVRP